MATVSKKRFVAFDAQGTDGTDFTKMKAIYRVVDSDGFSYESVRIAATTHNAGDDAAINRAIITAIES